MVLANLEVVLIRNIQLAGAGAAARVDLASPCHSKDTPHIAELNRQALQPAEAVLSKRGTEVRLDQLFKRLIKQEGAIKEHLRKCGEAIRNCDKRTLEVRVRRCTCVYWQARLRTAGSYAHVWVQPPA